ncbi:MAG: hypothetical protein WCG16_09020 [Methylococcales bacterium]
MNAQLKFLPLLLFLTLAACSTQEVKQTEATSPVIPEKNNSNAANSESGQAIGSTPPMTLMKEGRQLQLVKIMDGGICKNEYQGAKGAFLLYADTDDIERIKREKGTAIFRSFESKIQDLSGNVLQAAIDETNLAEDPFSLGEDEAQQKLATKLVANFRHAATPVVTEFQKETSLTIDITAFQPSLVFYQKGCDESRLDQDETNQKS